ncbi:malate synthase A [Pontibacter sp. JH31]|uniref:Malate synthase n=1 Tax=Pontibacter aquaedesilientis TaxID=2766980 RepID=A0ABR7XHM9_9BACT|nr:malate synthase A [Pontibacter aquaedesilientis]MBD1397775.1 malate synthase A [Pontibacter aquaedesilientis]
MILETTSAQVVGKPVKGMEEILTPETIEFLETLHQRFNATREERLRDRAERQKRIDSGEFPQFLPETAAIREGSWGIGAIPDDLQLRRVEITGPVDRKMVINALNSGADVFMADFEDANSPTWENVVLGQINLRDAVRRNIEYQNGKVYRLKEKVALLKVRPRGWHLPEKHLLVEGKPISASLFDFGLSFFHNAKELIARGSGPYFYLPKLESHLEARLWNEVFVAAQEALGIPVGTIKVTVLIETITAAFEMEEILYELRNHIVGLNAGRWDYIFSAIKKFRNQPDILFPDRTAITMQVPFMKAYTDLLVKTCHKRGAHAMGGMAAFIPNRHDPAANKTAFEKVKADKDFEAKNGFDGTWVAHPGLVSVAREAFDKVLGNKPHQKEVLREEVNVKAEDLLNFSIEGGKITEAGLRLNINVGILYLGNWLCGTGAAAIHNLMEDAATAEISRAQVWQWLHHNNTSTDDGTPITEERVLRLIKEETENIKEEVGLARFKNCHFERASQLFSELVLSTCFVEFLTLPAYKYMD